jgi:hypothetical protein
MNDCRELPYDIQESDKNHVLIKPRSSSKCDIPIIKLSHEKPSKGMPIFGGYLVEERDSSCNYGPVDFSMSTDQTVVFMNGKTGKYRKEALHKLNLQGHPNRQKYNEIGLKDPSHEVRSIAAYFLYLDLSRLIPALLKVITTDPNPDVKLHAALNLHCQITCNGVDYESKDALGLEGNLPMLERAIRDEVAGRYVVEILDSVWCDMTEKSRRSIASVLASDLPYGKSELGINDLAKKLLSEHSEPCH